MIFNDKKGMEIAITTVVGLILGALMLFAGVALVTNIVGKTNDAQSQVSEQMEQDIIDAFDNNDLVYVHRSQIEVKGKEDAVFGLGIHNIYGNERDFRLKIVSEDNIEEDPADKFNGNGVKVAFSEDNISIEPRGKFATFVIVPTINLESGQHSLPVRVEHYNGSEWLPHGKPKLLYVIK